MLEGYPKTDPSQTQRLTSQLLTVYALIAVILGPIVGYVADTIPSRKATLLFSLGAEVLGTAVVATCISRMYHPSIPFPLLLLRWWKMK